MFDGATILSHDPPKFGLAPAVPDVPSPVLHEADHLISTFPSGSLVLHGVLFKPEGKGPFPAVLFNHGSYKDPSDAVEALGPVFASRVWVMFAPHRRGQGLSAEAGAYIQDQIRASWQKGGVDEAAVTMTRLLETDHLSDQIAGFEWLKKQEFVSTNRIAVFGNSFGGIESLLGIGKLPYCAGVDASGGAESWSKAAELQTAMKHAARNSHGPIFLLQAENDYDLAPSFVLASEMKDAGKSFQLSVYPSYGNSEEEGHSFA